MKYRTIAAAALVVLSAGAARADVVFDTYTGQSLVGVSGPGSDGSALVAQSFMASGTQALDQISVALLADDPTDGGSVVVYLAPDDGTGSGTGMPGNPDFGDLFEVGTIADSVLNSTSDADPSLASATGYGDASLQAAFASATSLTGNSEYWVVLDLSNSSAEFAYNADDSGIGAVNQEAYSDANGLYADDGSAGQGAFEAVVETPEPATIAILGAAITGLGVFRRRARRPAAEA